jgi:hypothetical protein
VPVSRFVLRCRLEDRADRWGDVEIAVRGEDDAGHVTIRFHGFGECVGLFETALPLVDPPAFSVWGGRGRAFACLCGFQRNGGRACVVTVRPHLRGWVVEHQAEGLAQQRRFISAP